MKMAVSRSLIYTSKNCGVPWFCVCVHQRVPFGKLILENHLLLMARLIIGNVQWLCNKLPGGNYSIIELWTDQLSGHWITTWDPTTNILCQYIICLIMYMYIYILSYITFLTIYIYTYTVYIYIYTLSTHVQLAMQELKFSDGTSRHFFFAAKFQLLSLRLSVVATVCMVHDLKLTKL